MDGCKQTLTADTDAVVDETLERKRSAMLERLSNRHLHRVSGQPDSTSSSTLESTQSFLASFSQSKRNIESQICEIREHHDSSRKSDLESTSLEISALEKLVAENSYFLPPYEVRTCHNTVAQLKQLVDDVTALVIPKKKFSFKNKPSRKAIVIADHKEVPGISEPWIKPNLEMENIGFRDFIAGPGFRNRENEVLTMEFDSKEPGQQNGEFTLSGLSDCEVRLKGQLRALFMDKLKNCKVYIGAVMGSVLIDGTAGCVFVLASHQIRIHNAKSCDFYLRVRSRPIIEDSCGVRFAPYCLRYQGLEKDLMEANLGEETGNWCNVDDFRWLRAVQSPNWSVLPENERIQMTDISMTQQYPTG